MRETEGRKKNQKNSGASRLQIGRGRDKYEDWKRELNRSFGYLVTDIMEKKTFLASITVKSETLTHISTLL